jgi:hypothetical protein
MQLNGSNLSAQERQQLSELFSLKEVEFVSPSKCTEPVWTEGNNEAVIQLLGPELRTDISYLRESQEPAQNWTNKFLTTVTGSAEKTHSTEELAKLCQALQNLACVVAHPEVEKCDVTDQFEGPLPVQWFELVLQIANGSVGRASGVLQNKVFNALRQGLRHHGSNLSLVLLAEILKVCVNALDAPAREARLASG